MQHAVAGAPCAIYSDGSIRRHLLQPIVRPRPCLRGLPARRRAEPKAAAAHSRPMVLAAQAAQEGKLISKTEIPAFIPRSDMMDQLVRWAVAELQEEGAIRFGLPIRISPIYQEEALWGFKAAIVRDGATLTELGVKYDDETVSKHEWVGKKSDGFPSLQGNVEEVAGKNLEIRKLDNNPVDEQLRSVIRGVCQSLVAAINKYYAFGSCFVDDST